MSSVKYYRESLLLFGSIVIVMLVFFSTSFSYLVFFSLIPLLYIIRNINSYTTKEVLYGSWMYGILYSSVVMFWVVQTSPSEWTALTGPFAWFSKAIVYLLTVATLSLGFVISGWFLNRYKSKQTTIMLLLPFIWIFGEIVRTYLFSILNLGPGGSLGLHHNFGILGLGVANTDLVFLSRFVGLYGLTFVAVIGNMTLYFMFAKQYRKATLLVLPLLFFNILAINLYKVSNESIQVASVHLGETDNLSQWSIPYPISSPDIMVLPEYSLFFENSKHQAIAEKNFPNTTLITSVSHSNGPSENTLTFYDSSQGIYSEQNKTFLAPVGETMPYVLIGMLNLFNMNNVVENFNATQQIRQGETREVVVQTPAAKVGAFPCSGILHSSEYARLTRQGAQVLVNSASLSLLHSNSVYHVHERYLTRFHAVANARPFIQSSRSGESYILNSNGDTLQYKTDDSGLIESSVEFVQSRTLYTLLSL